MLLPVVLGVVGAAFLGGGFVVQQREAAQVASDDAFSVRLLLELMRRRAWWGGIAAMTLGYVLTGWSLGSGNLVLVEPLIASNLIFALLIAARWCRRWPSRRSMLGAVLLTAGVAGFVLAGNPHGGASVGVAAVAWGWSGAAVAAVVAVLVWSALKRHGTARASLLGAATGVSYGMQDALTRRVFAGFEHQGLALLAGWPLWVLVAVGTLGLLLAQNAFDFAPLTSSLPAISVSEPMTGIVLGIALFHSHVRTDVASLVLQAVALAVMFAGAVLVSRARVVHEATSAPDSASLARAA